MFMESLKIFFLCSNKESYNSFFSYHVQEFYGFQYYMVSLKLVLNLLGVPARWMSAFLPFLGSKR